MDICNRFRVVYHVRGSHEEALDRARAICLEQTVEMDDCVVPDGFIRDHITGRLESFGPMCPPEDVGQNEASTSPLSPVPPPTPVVVYQAVISYAVDTTARELTQFLNVVFGNTSLKPGIRIHGLDPGPLLESFRGPRFGIEGLRRLVQVWDRPLLCTALKPMGRSPAELADIAEQFASGGMDVIKDDHGLTNQAFCPYRERVEACVEAVRRANARTGRHAIYVPNVTAPTLDVLSRARLAREAGAGGLLVAPGLVGFDAMRTLAEDDTIGLPILSHPAFLGSLVTAHENGIRHGILFGQLQRMAGADASIYPNWGGRFGFTRAECLDISRGCKDAMGAPSNGERHEMSPIFPTPGGGMNLDRLPELVEAYGNDVLFLVGGALYGRSPDLEASARTFLDLVKQRDP